MYNLCATVKMKVSRKILLSARQTIPVHCYIKDFLPLEKQFDNETVTWSHGSFLLDGAGPRPGPRLWGLVRDVWVVVPGGELGLQGDAGRGTDRGRHTHRLEGVRR